MAGRESKLVAAKTEVIQHCALPQLSCKAHWPARSAPSLQKEKAFSSRTAKDLRWTLHNTTSSALPLVRPAFYQAKI